MLPQYLVFHYKVKTVGKVANPCKGQCLVLRTYLTLGLTLISPFRKWMFYVVETSSSGVCGGRLRGRGVRESRKNYFLRQDFLK